MVVLLAIWSGTAYSAFAQQSAPAQESAHQQWIPFVAKVVEQHQIQVGQRENVTVPRIVGVYARNSLGLTYRLFSAASCLPLAASGADFATLYDPDKGVTYVIDFRHKTATRVALTVAGLWEVGPHPTSREVFEQKHTEDLPLGKQVISGVECEGYGIHDPKSKKKKKFTGEAWYAPALNFVAVKTEGRTPDGGTVSTVLEDVRVGEEPEPGLFRIPEGFKLVQ